MKRSVFLSAAMVLAACAGVGCAVQTPGTQRLRADQMAQVTVPKHLPAHDLLGNPVHVRAVYIDGLEYPLKRDQDFWLTPGRHTFRVFYGECDHRPEMWLKESTEGLAAGMAGDGEEVLLDAKPGRKYRFQAYTTADVGPTATRQFFVEK